MITLLIALGAFGATIAGGLMALRLEEKLHLILGFSAGAVVGVALLDLIPEATELGRGDLPGSLGLWIALGFVTYMILDRLIPMKPGAAPGRRRGVLGAASLFVHSLLDGFGIGLGFQVSNSVGLVVAAAVLAHDFSDGINTVNVALNAEGSRTRVKQWLVADALAPAIGIALSEVVVVPDRLLGSLLALFAGFFLYIGASQLVPGSYHRHPKSLTTVMTLLGLGVIYVSVELAR